MSDIDLGLRALTELGGVLGSDEQRRRLINRYEWAAGQCDGLDVVEVACGAGLGLGVIRLRARSVLGGDVVEETVADTRRHYGDRVRVERFSAEQIPLDDNSVDVVILFEALYYLTSSTVFFREVARILRTGGILLLATANKDLLDFTPSPYSTNYLGVLELRDELEANGYTVEFYGDIAIGDVPIRQRILRPLKAIAGRLGLVPRTLGGREWLKRIFFGRLVQLPTEITEEMFTGFAPTSLTAFSADISHKVIFCRATLATK